MNRINLLTIRAFATVLIFLLSACAEDPLGGNNQTGEGHTVTLQLSATVAPIPETKATATPARSGSDAVASGFNVDMESTTLDSVVISLGTKAPATLKNVYALLFTSAGAFNGRANIGAFTAGVAAYITFVDVKTTTAKDCRLVVVANDANATINYSSSTAFGSFSGTYADFQKLTIKNEIKKDEDIPYAGSAIIGASLSESGVTADVPLSWTLAKITLKNHKFEIIGGPARSSITLYNAGERRFATPNNDNYDGTGITETTAFVASTAGSNANSVTWYVGENIQPAVASIQTPADRNSKKAPANACYIRVASETLPISKNTSPKIGEEYTQGGTKSFTYDYYLGRSSDKTDFALRRHTNYTISTEISGTLVVQEALAAIDGRVTLKMEGSAGLAIGMLGGASGYTPGTGTAPTISGSYTKMLLIQPNTSGSTATDNVIKQWSIMEYTQFQTETRNYWDHTYTSTHIDQTAGFASDYCKNLTLGGVSKGTWYLPTQAQSLAIWSVFCGLQENSSFANYSAFDAMNYWTSTEYDQFGAGLINLKKGDVCPFWDKPGTLHVRCVRDAASSLSAPMVTTVDGYPVIDVSALNPLGCVLSSSEAKTRHEAMYAPGVTPSNEALLSVGLDVSGPNGTWNAKMSTNYQVMKQDHSVGETDFATAWNLCKKYAGEGGSQGTWRLPTQRELDMIWVLHPQLIGKAGFTAFTATDYKCSTEDDARWAWSMGFSDGFSDYRGKDIPHNVRCVKDL